MKKLSPKGRKITEFIVLASVIILSFIFWNTYYIFPIKIFVVLLHEISHGLAAIASGGNILEIQINYNLGGVCKIKGGNSLLIASAGYIGSLLWGGLLFLSARKQNFSTYVCTFISIGLIIITALFIKHVFGIFFTLGFAIFLFISPRYLPDLFHQLSIKTLGIISCLYTIFDIKSDLITLNYRSTDAQVIANITNVPALFWGILMLTVSLLIFYLLIRANFKKAI